MAVWDELKVVLVRLRDQQPGTLMQYPMPDVDEGGQPPFTIGLAPWAAATAEELHRQLERAVSCADVYAPADHWAGLREQIADSTLAAATRARPGSPVQRTLAAAFAASAHRGDQLDLLTAWLDGNQAPGRPTLTRCRSLTTPMAQDTGRRAWRCGRIRMTGKKRGGR